MANTPRIRGFVPAKSLIGAPWQSLVRQYPATNPASGIYIGDPVKLVSGLVVRAVAGDEILGVVVAVGKSSTTFGATGYFDANDLGKRYLGAAESGVVGVVPAELALFNVTSNADLDLLLGDVADILPAAGSNLTGNSAYTIKVATAFADVKVVEQNTNPKNESGETGAEYIVQFQKTVHLASNV